MLLAARSAFLAQKKKLSFDSAVEYLESTGTQWIDTGVVLDNNCSVEISYNFTLQTQYRVGLFGGLGTGNIRFGSLCSPSNAYLEHGYGISNAYWQTGIPDLSRHVLKQDKNLVYFDGELVHSFSTAVFAFSKSAPFMNFDYTNYNPAKARYYWSKWWFGYTLVRDFIPCRIGTTGYMYDKVSKQLFGNKGTGNFLYGKDVKVKL